ncbi:type IV pilus assembly protein PilA [Halolactibacillus halophilus]|uniref:Type IV pilus assembly protein PilA n=1 Tax=Halolactibacillus halophilus TaxID=306540 RepID=A0A1I5L1A6_9BACI|nr:type II secretion system protein [Halolactibacillus halophilus]GEM00596.1 hypothetical protein HHA03_01280 [Halolactibacillus halophilus]SFO90922.1 type IV pilus assembly protein PilA [Halolactibacillus halophilus]
MVNKFKTLLKKEKGFTLVELLAVIVILGIIVAIAVPAIGNIINDAENNAAKSEVALVQDAARLYDVQNEIPTEGITAQDLIDAGYLDTRSTDYDPTTVKITVDAENQYEVDGLD